MASNDNIHPDEVLAAILSKGIRKDKELKLKKLHELCSLEYNRHTQGARDFSLSGMSKAAESHGLFKARTIYNAQSKDYADLIKSWENYNGPTISKKLSEKTALPDKYSFLKKIDDPAIRSLCQIAIADRDKLKAELNMLKSKTQVVVDMRPMGAQIAKTENNVVIVEPASKLTESERNALINAIDPKMLSRRKWRIGETGEVVDEKERFIFNPGFTTGIAKILGILNVK